MDARPLNKKPFIAPSGDPVMVMFHSGPALVGSVELEPDRTATISPGRKVVITHISLFHQGKTYAVPETLGQALGAGDSYTVHLPNLYFIFGEG